MFNVLVWWRIVSWNCNNAKSDKKLFLFHFNFQFFVHFSLFLLMKSLFCSFLFKIFYKWTFWLNGTKTFTDSLLHHFLFKTIRFIEIFIHIYLSQIDNLCIWVNISMHYLSNKQIHKFILFCYTNALILKYVRMCSNLILLFSNHFINKLLIKMEIKSLLKM